LPHESLSSDLASREFWSWPAQPSPRQFLRPFVLALVIAMAIGGTLAVTTYGTNDILFFKSYAVKAEQTGVAPLYREGANLVEFHTDWVEQMAHPPGVILIWRATLWVEGKTGVPFHVWFRILTTIAHALTALALFRMLGGRAAAAFVLSPAAILLASFHGNSDPLVVVFLIWAVYCVEKRSPVWLTGLLFAAACSIKVWPLFLLPAFYLYLANWRQRTVFLATVPAAWFAFGAPYTFQFPMLILRTVFGYRSVGHWWGLAATVPGYDYFGTILTFAAVLAITVYLHSKGTRLYGIAGGAIAVFLVLTPGFGVNYLAWILPFCLWLEWRAIAGVYLSSSVLLILAYTRWSGGFPWYFADLLRPGAALSWTVQYAATVCWVTLLLAVLSMTPVLEWIFGRPVPKRRPIDRTGPAAAP
jgi:hypothetical protein